MKTPKRKDRERILQQPMWPLMWRMSLPGMLGMLLVGINNFLDALFVSRGVSETAFNGVSMAFPLTVIVFGIASCIGMGTGSVLSRAVGAEDRAKQRRLMPNFVIMGLSMSLPVAAAYVLFPETFIRWSGGEGAILEAGAIYLRNHMYFGPIMVFALGLNFLIRAEGNVPIAMLYSGLFTAVNITLNALFIYGLGWGVAGAAWATNCATLVFFALNVLYFIRGKAQFEVAFERWTPDWSMMREVMSVGFSELAWDITFMLKQALMLRTMATIGNDHQIALLAAGYRLLMLTVIPVFGIVGAMQPVIGINYGAKQFDRVRQAFRVFNLSGFALLTTIWMLMMMFTRPIIEFLLPETPLTTDELWSFRLLVMHLPLTMLIYSSVTFFQSLGNGSLAVSTVLTRQLIAFVPAILILPTVFGINGVFLSVPVSDLTAVVLVVVFDIFVFRNIKRQENRKVTLQREPALP